MMIGELIRQKGVSIDRLARLCEIEQAGGIMAAANNDPSKQSLLSRQIKEVEEALGYKLLDRTSSPSRLNAAGKSLSRMIRTFLVDFDRVAASLGQHEIPLRIAASESLSLAYLIPILSKLTISETRSIQLLNLRSRESSTALSEGRVDLAISHSLESSTGVSVKKLAGYGVRLVGIKSKKEKKWSDLGRRPLITVAGDGKLRTAVNELVENNPSGPFILMDCTSHHQILVACEEMGAIAVIPEIALGTDHAKKLGYSKIKELNSLQYSVACGWNKERAKEDPELTLLIKEILK
ncbi:LysR family transcriptional regulator [Akkermansiaceae bacterium]|nr:LysR family transcriptional regulator [Akkermansiaceae bacterium]